MYYDIAVTEAINRIKSLKSMMLKVVQQGQWKWMSSTVILDLALADDMFSLKKQLQIVTDISKWAIARLTDIETPVFEDTESTIDEIYARLDTTIAFLETVKAEDFDGADDKIVEMEYFEWKHFTWRGYFTSFYIPNLHFHATTAYDICRAYKFEIGKADYAGNLPLIDNK